MSRKSNPHAPHEDEFLPWKEDWRNLGHIAHYVRAVERVSYGRGYCERGQWVPGAESTDRPACGDRWSYGNWEDCKAAEASHVLLFSFSDYSGGSYDRSNYEYVKEEYPRSFIDVYGGHGTSGILIPVTSRNPYLFRAVHGTIDYPLIDDEHHSALEMREADEAWDQFLRSDVRHELSREGAYGTDDVLDALDEFDENPDNRDNNPRDSLRDWYYESLQDGNESPYLETAVNIVFPEHGKSMEFVTAKLWQWRAEEFAPRQEALPLPIPIQIP